MAAPETTRQIKQPRGVYSPYFGCTIFAVMILCVGGGLTMAYYSLKTQDAAFAEIAQHKPAELNPKVIAVADHPALLAKLDTFKQAVTDKKAASLELSVEELNTVIQLAPDSGYGGFKSMLAFTQVDAAQKQLRAAVCFPINKIKFWEGLRYIVGEAVFQPKIDEKAGIDMQMLSLTIPGKTANQNLVDRLMLWQWLSPYIKLEGIGPVLRAVTDVTVTATGVSLSTDPTKVPPPLPVEGK
jgi:hypothetical protein